jgi:hypothetical protein
MYWIKKHLWLLICLSIVLTKLLIIDIDLPDWSIAYYQPIDEFYYSYLAYNIYEANSLFGEDHHQIIGHPILTNIFTYLSLFSFGNTYLGLRFSSILFGLLSTILFSFLIKRITSNHLIQNGLTLFLVLNFSFTLSNIVLEPTICRIMTMLFSLYLIVISYKNCLKNKYVLFAIASCITFLFLITYANNLFIVLAGYLSLVIFPTLIQGNVFQLKHIGDFLKNSLVYTLAVITGISVYLLLVFLLGDHISESLTHTFKASGAGKRVGFGIKQILNNVVNIRLSNLFVFNPLLLLLTGIVIYDTLSRHYSKFKIETIISLSFLIGFVLQSLFINDYPQRKLIILLPLLLLIMANRCDSLLGKINLKEISKKDSVMRSILFIGLSFYAIVYTQSQNYIFVIPVIIFILFSSYLILIKKYINNKSIYMVLFLLILPEIYNSADHLIINRSYHYKKSFQKLAKYDGSNFYGGWSLAFTPYNKIKPSLNFYLYYGKMDSYWFKLDSLSQNGVQDYSIAYKEDENKYNKIGYEQVEVLMKSENTRYSKDILLYKENPVK